MTTDLVPDELWERIVPLLPKRPARRKRHPGRLPVPDRVALAGIIYVLRKGVAWRDVPSEVVGCSGGSLDMDDAAIDGSHIRALKGWLMSGRRRWIAAAPAPSTM